MTQFDLELRTLNFALEVRLFCKQVPKGISNLEDTKQLIRAAGSIGANYIEANESLGKKDFKMRIKICKKEAKETAYWLKLIDLTDRPVLEGTREALIKESNELMNIFGAILIKT